MLKDLIYEQTWTMVGYTYVNFSVRHNDCWTSQTDLEYYDTLLNLEFSSFNALKADRLAVIRKRKEESKRMIKLAMENDRSVIEYEFSNLAGSNKSNVYLISMIQQADEPLISKLKSMGAIILNANVRNGVEHYDILHRSRGRSEINRILSNDTKIKVIGLNFKTLNEKEVYKVISRNVSDILMTEKEQSLLRKAKELGYFESPKRVNLDEFAKELNISKMYVSLSIRKILKKIYNLI
ncbi:bacterio-opsin activator [Candidatus Acidianus copahuensis]|uniref:Bacterio-opsin activator n=1 Tax=Candidatus Acidianus copahuensis TaxID=1160895 RepID=A0A031LUT6_9CREN|nr:helix-turn-helix domain-containing protein [Candidatus Acidianus copahuensis]EZQ11530.1 bacterio-opsin activator [Candidatus Acidianus copahuensis]